MICKTAVQELRSRVSLPWFALACVWALFIWGNSLVPGEGSGGMSMAVVDAAHRVLGSCGLPYEWITNLLVRKTGHFIEYLVLGLISTQVAHSNRSISRRMFFGVMPPCVFTAAIDETIQLFVPGRCGQITDVLLDCCGALAGVFLHLLAHGCLRKTRAIKTRS